jgi:argininosuccinate synthase
MLGLKVRENYEHPAATVLLTAHEALEQLVLTAEEREFKTDVENEWAGKAYEGLLDSPLGEALESFVATTQEAVTGTVTVKLHGGTVRPVARESEYAVYSEAAASFDTSGVDDNVEQDDATGVAKYHGFQSRLAKGAGPTEAEVITDGGNAPEE